MKLKPTDQVHGPRFASTYVRARMRLMRSNKSTENLASVEEILSQKENGLDSPTASHKDAAERKKRWRHTRDLGKRSPSTMYVSSLLCSVTLEETDLISLAFRHHGEFLREIGKDDIMYSQPVRSISIMASDSSDEESSPPGSFASHYYYDPCFRSDSSYCTAKHGNALTKRLSRDLTKLRHFITSDSSPEKLPAAESSGKKFWTTGRNGAAQLLPGILSPKHSKAVSSSMSSIDWDRQPSKDDDTSSKGAPSEGEVSDDGGAKPKGRRGRSISTDRISKKKMQEKLRFKKRPKKSRTSDLVEREESWERDDVDTTTSPTNTPEPKNKKKKPKSQEGTESGSISGVEEEETSSASGHTTSDLEPTSVTPSSSPDEDLGKLKKKTKKKKKKKKERKKEKERSEKAEKSEE